MEEKKEEQVVKLSDYSMESRYRYVPFVGNFKIRVLIGFILLFLSAALAGVIIGGGRIEIMVSIAVLAWLPSIFLTDKYVHKYPQRYLSYLIASHLKAAGIMAFFLWIFGKITGPIAAPHDVLWTGYIFFVFIDALVSVPNRREISDKPFSVVSSSPSKENIPDNKSTDSDYTTKGFSSIDAQAIVNQIRPKLEKPLVEFIEKHLPGNQGGIGEVLVCGDITTTDDQSKPGQVGLLVGLTRINDVRRLNRFLQYCLKRITMGGYLVVSYTPLESVERNLKRRYKGVLYWPAFILHYIWYRALPKIPWLDTLYFWSKISWLDTLYLSIIKRRNRVLSKAEVWGRLSFCGMQVIAESNGDGEKHLIAQLVEIPVQDKRPSYYPIVALKKVGLDGEILHTHKIRTMYPFSEFLQKRIFEENGLASSGKFNNDFRLTEMGKFLRKYWLDELPQIFDWLRGDIKLVGMRATSPHFLSLYPRNLLDLYVQIKPGLIPPIFDNSTTGFEQIVEVELTYLRSYWDQPFRTDVRYLFQTFTDIVFKGIRSH